MADNTAVDGLDKETPIPTHINLADDGDTILVLRHEDSDAHLRVSSTILSYASPVFRALVAPGKFAEGSTPRSASAPKEIELPEDDAVAMQDLCSALHYKHEKLNELIACPATARRIMELCVLADKYSCAEAVCFVVEALISRFLEDNNGDDDSLESRRYLAAAAYILRLPSRFKCYTRGMVMNETQPFANLLDQRCGEVLTLCVVRMYTLALIVP